MIPLAYQISKEIGSLITPVNINWHILSRTVWHFVSRSLKMLSFDYFYTHEIIFKIMHNTHTDVFQPFKILSQKIGECLWNSHNEILVRS